MKRLLFYSISFFCVAGNLWAQEEEPQTRRGSRIIDDTTRQVYGPTTSKYYHEHEVFFNRTRYYPIDTVIRNFHRFNYVQRFENFYQDLGNIGTAMRHIYYQIPETIGARSGFHSYDVYWNTEQIRYYDTKSPYTNMKVILGGKGRSITRATYSRNINPLWNIGFNYRGLFIDKQVQRLAKGDRNVRSNYYDFYTAYQTKDSTYRLFLNYRRHNHEADEYGGIREFAGDFIYKDYFDERALPSLTDAESRELRMNIHLYHHYEVGKALQVYHVLDRYRQGNRFEDRISAEPGGYYGPAVLPGDTISDYVKFKTFRNEAGIKGNLLKLFYNGYYAIREYSMEYKYTFHRNDTLIDLKTKGVESYLGGRMSLKLDSLLEVSGWAEVMQNGNYRMDGRIRSKWFEASLQQVQYTPSFLEQAYLGKLDFWNNRFSNVNVTRISGNILYDSRVLQVIPGLTLTRIGNYVFFKEFNVSDDPQALVSKVLPVQTSGDQIIASPQLRLSLTLLRHIHLRGNAVYSRLLETSENAIQLPELFVNGQLAYENIFFNGNLDMHAGVDVHWKSDYNALAYNITTQQFYVQEEINFRNRAVPVYKVPAFPVIDIFFNAKIKRGRIFIKYNNVLQMLTGEGYMLTPYYPGQRTLLDFGFDWSFYD